MAYREDTISLRPPKRLADGRLRADGWFSKVGVQEYYDPISKKMRREYRPPEEVFHPDSLASFEGLIVTDGHPPELITAENASKYRKGQGGESVRQDGEHVAGTLYVDELELINDVQSRRKSQLSVGYKLEIDETPGVAPDGKRYDAIQRKIRANHLAIVPKGRAGTAHVRLDSAEPGPFQVAYQKENHMGAKKDDNSGAASTQALADALTRNTKLEEELAKEKARADAAEGRVAGLEEAIEKLRSERTDSDKIAELEVERDEQKARADAAEAKLAVVPQMVTDGVARRVSIEKGAIAVLGEKDEKGQPRRFDDLTNRQIMEDVVNRASGVDLSDRSDDYVSARFDACVEAFRAGSEAQKELSRRTAIDQKKAQNAARGDSTAQKREDAREKRRNAWQEPLPSEKLKNA